MPVVAGRALDLRRLGRACALAAAALGITGTPRAAVAQGPAFRSAVPCGSRAGAQPPFEPAVAGTADLAVLAFRAPAVPGGEPPYLGPGFAAAVAARLRALPSLTVRSTVPLDAPEPASAADAQRIGRAAGARHLVAGDVTREGQVARVRVRVFRVSDGRRVAATEYAVPAAQLPGLEAQVAVAAAAHVQGRPLTAAELGAIGRTRAPRPAAYDPYLLGQALATRRTPEALGRAAASFARAAELDPAFGEAHARAANAFAELVERGWAAGAPQLLVRDAYAHATKATTVDPSLALGWATLARVAGLEAGLPIAGAARAAERAVALAPRDAEAVYGAARAHWNAGNVAAAEPLLVRAAALDGSRSAPLVDLADARAGRRDWVGACAAVNRAVVVDERDPYAYALRALVRLRMGETRDAWADAETVALLGRANDGIATSAVVDAFAGDTARVRAKLRPFLVARGAQAAALSAWEGRLLGLAAAVASRPADALELVSRVRPRGGLLRTALLDAGFDTLRNAGGWAELGGPAGTASPGGGRAGASPSRAPGTRPAPRESPPGTQ